MDEMVGTVEQIRNATKINRTGWRLQVSSPPLPVPRLLACRLTQVLPLLSWCSEGRRAASGPTPFGALRCVAAGSAG